MEFHEFPIAARWRFDHEFGEAEMFRELGFVVGWKDNELDGG
jgi:hypothetical protein